MTLVATPVTGGKGCLVCSLPPEKRREVNAAIWQGKSRVRDYIAAGHRVYTEMAGKPCDRKVITRHAEHIEATWRKATVEDPPTRREDAVFPTDYETIVDTAARVGMKAMLELERKLEEDGIESRELVGIAKMGVVARAQQRASEIDAKRPHIMLTAVFGLASGHLAQLPETEAVEVFEEGALLAQVREERKLLEERARG